MLLYKNLSDLNKTAIQRGEWENDTNWTDRRVKEQIGDQNHIILELGNKSEAERNLMNISKNIKARLEPVIVNKEETVKRLKS